MKCYLILRENVESGPFTLEEMQTKALLPTDLIWVEGASQSWKFPYEIAGLAPLVQQPAQKELETFGEQAESNNETNETKRVFVALPPQPSAAKPLHQDLQPVQEEAPVVETGFVQPLETLRANLEAHRKNQEFKSKFAALQIALFKNILNGR